MSTLLASDIERLLSPCSAIGFRTSEDREKHLPTIILGFDDEASGAVAYNALRRWAKDDELMIALHNKAEYIDASLIHTGTHEAVIISRLSFNEKNFFDFISIEPQDRRLTIGHGMNPITRASVVGSDPSALILFRYIVVASSENQT